MYRFIAALCLVALAQATPFRNCGGSQAPYAQLVELRVEGCTALPCVVQRGTNISIELDFTSRTEITAFESQVFGDLGGILAPWPGDGFPTGCSALSAGDCPISVDETATYTAQLAVSTFWPAISAEAVWKLVDQDSVEFACFRVPVKLI